MSIEINLIIFVNLVKGILNGDDRSILDESVIHLAKLLRRNPVGRVRLGVLEVEIVLAVLVELGGGHVHADLDLAGVAGLLDGVTAKSDGLLLKKKENVMNYLIFSKNFHRILLLIAVLPE